MNKHSVTAIVLAGGKGRRMGGLDKGLVSLCGRSLLQWVTTALAPQVDEIVVSANRNVEQYRQAGYRVIGDELADFQGPLAGVLACGKSVDSDYLAVVAVDAPLLPTDFVPRLRFRLERNRSDLAVAEVDGVLQPTHILFARDLLADLEPWLAQGNRKMRDWVLRQRHEIVSFDDDPFSIGRTGDTPV
jgi:molybdopterin-guanine dinucleotide biosynthesis protein A